MKAWQSNILIFIFAMISFALLDTERVSTGDDLGYMFANTTIHSGDGERIESVMDIVKTQASHYMNCNGRFIIHGVTQLFVSLLPGWVFVLCNALMFALLWYLSLSLLRLNDSASGIKVALLLMIWLCVPRPGVTMLSLVAFSVNYLWGAVVTLLFLLMLRKSAGGLRCPWIYALVAFLIGTMHEGYSLPVSGALFILAFFRRYRKYKSQRWLVIPYWLGTCVLLISPGNFSHAGQGGGITISSLAHKMSALSSEIIWSDISLLFILLVASLIISRNYFREYCCRNILLIVATILSVLLACISFTAVRQLFAPAIFSMLMLFSLLMDSPVRKILGRSVAPYIIVVVICSLLGGAYVVRRTAMEKMSYVVDEVKKGSATVALKKDHDVRIPLLLTPLLVRFTCDPFQGRDLKILFDGYTKRGLSRIYSPSGGSNSLRTVLPCPLSEIKRAALSAKSEDGRVITAKLPDSTFRTFIRPDSCAYRWKLPSGGKCNYEKFREQGVTYFVVPEDVKIIILK